MLITLALTVATATPDPYAIFSRARSRWGSQSYPPFMSYVVRTSAVEGAKVATNTYTSFTDTSNNAITVRATSAEEAAHQYVPHGISVRAKGTISYRRHPQLFSAPTVDGDGDLSVSKTIKVSNQEQYDVLGVPMLSPTYSFGLAPAPISVNPNKVQPGPSRLSDLRTIAIVTAVHSDYDIRYDGTEVIDDAVCYHLRLTPRRDPAVFRLRQLWIDQDEFATRQALVQGNFTRGPGPRLPWLIHFALRDDLMYIADETSPSPVKYLGHTYKNVTIVFSNIHSTSSPDPMRALSMFRTSGDVLEEP